MRNLGWVEELYQAEQVLNFGVKEIAGRLEKEYGELIHRSLRKYMLVVEHIGENSVRQYFRKAREVELKLAKPRKLEIFQQIFTHYAPEEHPLQQVIPQHFHDKFGWQIFRGFMAESWQAVKELPQGEVFKRLRALGRDEQAENLMEVSWDDVGGLETAKEEIVQTVLLPIRHP